MKVAPRENIGLIACTLPVVRMAVTNCYSQSAADKPLPAYLDVTDNVYQEEL